MSGNVVIGGRPRVVLAGVLVGGLAALLACAKNVLPFRSADLAPSPWRVAKIQGGTALRLAMVHDVLHERYLRHGSAWYAARNVQAQKVIDAGDGARDPAVWEAMNDLAVGLERLGQGERAIEVMRRKLSLLPGLPTTRPIESQPLRADYEVRQFAEAAPLGPLAYHHYTAHANLGTSLIHRSFAGAMAGDAAAKQMLREGLGHIQEAIAINPIAHFGRERWQAIAVQHLLAAIERPEMWTKYDLCGDVLDNAVEKAHARMAEPGYVARRLRGQNLANLDVDARAFTRQGIPGVGSDPEWYKTVGQAYEEPVPFDEPVLGLIGMWTMGGGPNPLSALTLGRTMERVEQPYIAFTAYERALEMKDRLGPTPEIQEKLAAYCNERQKAVAQTQQPDDVAGWMERLRSTHKAELAWGRQYQQEYHDYEAKQIAAGVRLDDPHFYDVFFNDRKEIASDPGLADDMYVSEEHAKHWMDVVPLALVGTGVGMLLAIALPEKGSSKRLGGGR